ncbi:MAG: peptidoglycan DD-metalloendopeptidase family protein [Candidatus Pacebacteria bacterium]|nr:peptidoglycan DD-metalloendopeptidase family protein [Candidatus Paceibacterota bacterium]
MKKWERQTTLTTILIILTFVFCFPAYSQTVDELKQKISNKGVEIEKLEEEIDEYNREIVKVQAEASTLSHAINELDWTRKKLLTNIAVTGNEIDSTEFTIEKLQIEINNTTKKIQLSNNAIGEIIRNIEELDQKSLVEVVLSTNELSEFWSSVETLQQFRSVVSENLVKLEVLKKELQKKKWENEDEKESLENLTDKLEDQKYVVEVNKREKSYLLTETKNEESAYQKLLAEKKAAKEAFEKEIAEYESQLEFILNKDLLPELGSGVLGWPLKDISLDSCYDGSTSAANCVTQYFGNTAFARSGAYNGQGHNGIDFRASVGEDLLATAAGTIAGIGDTDGGGCYSYGKWVLITHDNGLSTLYAHLSKISVYKGQYVQKGEFIGLSGNTGYSTGPHLHMSVFATDGINIVRLGDWYKEQGRVATTPCSKNNVEIPVAAYSAYLNPLDYLAQ